MNRWKFFVAHMQYSKYLGILSLICILLCHATVWNLSEVRTVLIGAGTFGFAILLFVSIWFSDAAAVATRKLCTYLRIFVPIGKLVFVNAHNFSYRLH